MAGYDWFCKVCGSRNIKVKGGEDGNPFNKKPERIVCEDCGFLIFDERYGLDRVGWPEMVDIILTEVLKEGE